MKEVLNRASPAERQRYAQIQQRKTELSQRMQAASTAQEALNEKDNLNVLPQESSGTIRGALTRKAKDAAENAAKNQYKEALKAYKSQNAAIFAERMKLIGEFLEFKAEYDELESAEKWLLLSMATRNQSSLLGFMQTQVSDESKQST